jgi:hypothetical protein
MTQNQPQKKARQVVSGDLPIYIVVEEDTIIRPSAVVEIVTPSQLPVEGNFYALTADGFKISKDTGIIKAVVDAPRANFLAKVEFVPKLTLPKIPPLVVARAWRFFQKVFAQHHTEAELMLMYNATERLYDLWCPKQEVSLAGVDYKMSTELQETPPEWNWVGTIHSHADFSPYHSGIDHRDEQDEDGVHITIGYVDDDEYCSLCASIMIGGKRWTIPPEHIALGLERTTAKRAKRGYYISTTNDQNYFDVILSDEEQAEMEPAMEQIDEEWMPRVTRKVFQNRSGGYGWTTPVTYYESGSTDFDEDEENGEWCLVGGRWKFIADEVDADDEDLSITDTDLGSKLDPAEIAEDLEDLESSRDAAIAADAEIVETVEDKESE